MLVRSQAKLVSQKMPEMREKVRRLIFEIIPPWIGIRKKGSVNGALMHTHPQVAGMQYEENELSS